jgi:hypothetical protein
MWARARRHVTWRTIKFSSERQLHQRPASVRTYLVTSFSSICDMMNERSSYQYNASIWLAGQWDHVVTGLQACSMYLLTFAQTMADRFLDSTGRHWIDSVLHLSRAVKTSSTVYIYAALDYLIALRASSLKHPSSMHNVCLELASCKLNSCKCPDSMYNLKAIAVALLTWRLQILLFPEMLHAGLINSCWVPLQFFISLSHFVVIKK